MHLLWPQNQFPPTVPELSLVDSMSDDASNSADSETHTSMAPSFSPTLSIVSVKLAIKPANNNSQLC